MTARLHVLRKVTLADNALDVSLVRRQTIADFL